MCVSGCAAISQTTQQAVDPSFVHQALHDSFHCVLCHVYLRIALLAMLRHPRDAAGVPSTDGGGGLHVHVRQVVLADLGGGGVHWQDQGCDVCATFDPRLQRS